MAKEAGSIPDVGLVPVARGLRHTRNHPRERRALEAAGKQLGQQHADHRLVWCRILLFAVLRRQLDATEEK